MTDELDLVVQEGIAKRKAEAAERKVERKRRKQTDEHKRGKRSHDSGGDFERQLEDDLYPFGVIKTNDSGALTGFDLERIIEDDRAWLGAEAKKRSTSKGFKILIEFVNQSKVNQAAIVKGHDGRIYWFIRHDVVLRLLDEAGYNLIAENARGYAKWCGRLDQRKVLKRMYGEETAK